uniref:Secreted protein n=1 Tax=Fagus sylvatica TaxID=28930 RepID=A0A2N9ICV2_FAGSY
MAWQQLIVVLFLSPDRASLFPPLPLSLTAAPSPAPPISGSNLLKPPHLSHTAAHVSDSSHLKALPQVDACTWGIE